MADVVAEAKTLEAAHRTNQLIVDTSKGLEEQVHWTSTKKKHSGMNLKREPNTCHWCGSAKGPHAWASCPAKGRTCTRCGGNDHFARVCQEQATFGDSKREYCPMANQSRGRGRGRSYQ